MVALAWPCLAWGLVPGAWGEAAGVGANNVVVMTKLFTRYGPRRPRPGPLPLQQRAASKHWLPRQVPARRG